MELKEIIFEFWKENPVSQCKLADTLQINRVTLAKILKGRGNIREDVALKIQKSIRDSQK